jgi:hypothetical protein
VTAAPDERLILCLNAGSSSLKFALFRIAEASGDDETGGEIDLRVSADADTRSRIPTGLAEIRVRGALRFTAPAEAALRSAETPRDPERVLSGSFSRIGRSNAEGQYSEAPSGEEKSLARARRARRAPRRGGPPRRPRR